MKKFNYDSGVNILHAAMNFLIDIDSGNFERLLMSAREVFSLKKDYLVEDAIKVYLEIDSMFDKTIGDERQDYCWKNISNMEDDKKQLLAEKIFKIYTLTMQAPVRNPRIFE